MKELNYTDVLGYTAERMSRGGVFLTVPGDPANTMTIGWGWIGPCWGRPVFVALVRPQRHTYGLLKQAGRFTVSVPTSNDLRPELAMAGSLSGRDVDKFVGHGITAAPGLRIDAPVVRECGLHFECRVVMNGFMPGESMSPEIHDRCYPKDDLHEMFFGEIVACYATDDAFAEACARQSEAAKGELTANGYQALAMTTLNRSLSERDMLINGVMGLCGEAGEAIDLVKKHLAQGHELDKERLAGELGDVAWYLAETARAIGMDLNAVLQMNVDKLKRRYPDGFSSERSICREP